MYVMIIKDFKNRDWIEKCGIYRVCAETIKGNVWIRAGTGSLVKVLKNEFKEVKGGKMRLSELARTVKYLEILKWRIISPNHVPNKPIGKVCVESYMINEFPYGSAFCYIFRKYKAKSGEPFKSCFCPKLPHTQRDRCRMEENVQPLTGEVLEPAMISCVLNREGNHRTVQEIIDELMDIPILNIMKFLQKIKLEQYQLSYLSSMWHFHVWHKIQTGHIDSVPTKRDYKDGYLQ